MRDLQRIARDLWDGALAGNHPTGPEIQRRHDLTKLQFDAVKRHVRESAKLAGIVWGLYPPTGEYMAASQNTGHARIILGWQLHHWQDAGQSADDTFAAAERGRLVSQLLARQVHDLAAEFDIRLDSLSREFEAEGDDEAEAA